jgi:hypothetical protein
MFRDEIVVRVANDLDARKFADWEFPPNVNAAVYVGRIGFGTSDEVFAMELVAVLVVPSKEPMFP